MGACVLLLPILIQIVSDRHNLELGASVYLMRHLLIFLRECEYKLLGKHIALLKLWMQRRQFLGDGLGYFLAITHCLNAIGGNAVGYKIIDHRLRTTLRKVFIIGITSSEIGMRSQLDSDIGVVIELM